MRFGHARHRNAQNVSLLTVSPPSHCPHVEYETGQRAARMFLETMTTGQPIVMEWISSP